MRTGAEGNSLVFSVMELDPGRSPSTNLGLTISENVSCQSFSLNQLPLGGRSPRLLDRLHQASFRDAVISAYNGRCALSGLPESVLLDAAHIIADKDERFGQPVIPNGIPL